jgi:hypothetical protein
MAEKSSAVTISIFDSRNPTVKLTNTAIFVYNKACVFADLDVSTITNINIAVVRQSLFISNKVNSNVFSCKYFLLKVVQI